MTVEILIPWGGACPHRRAALQWVLDRFAAEHPAWRVTVCEAPPGPWVKARAVMPAISASSADVVVVADADVWCDGLPAAVAAVQAGEPWAIPHLIVHRLSQQGTAAVLTGGRWEDQELDERAYQGVQGGGVVVTHRAVAEAVPLDPRFEGWGSEDESWAMALHYLTGPAWRGHEPLVHLWHPSQPRISRRRGSVLNSQLRRRYVQARSDPGAMRALLAEARDDLAASHPAVHDHAA